MKRFSINNPFIVLFTAFGLLLVPPMLQQCGSDQNNKETVPWELSSIPIKVIPAEDNQITDALSFQFQLVGCKSSYTISTIDTRSEKFHAYLEDSGCRVELVSAFAEDLSFEVLEYFPDFAVGSEALLYHPNDDALQLSIKVESQLLNPITARDKVIYTYSYRDTLDAEHIVNDGEFQNRDVAEEDSFDQNTDEPSEGDKEPDDAIVSIEYPMIQRKGKKLKPYNYILDGAVEMVDTNEDDLVDSCRITAFGSQIYDSETPVMIENGYSELSCSLLNQPGDISASPSGYDKLHKRYKYFKRQILSPLDLTSN